MVRYIMVILGTCSLTYLLTKSVVGYSEKIERDGARSEVSENVSIGDSFTEVYGGGRSVSNIGPSESYGDFYLLAKNDWKSFLEAFADVSGATRRTAFSEGIQGLASVDLEKAIYLAEDNAFFSPSVGYQSIVDGCDSYQQLMRLLEFVSASDLEREKAFFLSRIERRLADLDASAFKAWLSKKGRSKVVDEVRTAYAVFGGVLATRDIDIAREVALSAEGPGSIAMMNGIVDYISINGDYWQGPEFVLSLPPEVVQQELLDKLCNAGYSWRYVIAGKDTGFSQEEIDIASRNVALSMVLNNPDAALAKASEIVNENVRNGTVDFIESVVRSKLKASEEQ